MSCLLLTTDDQDAHVEPVHVDGERVPLGGGLLQAPLRRRVDGQESGRAQVLSTKK